MRGLYCPNSNYEEKVNKEKKINKNKSEKICPPRPKLTPGKCQQYFI